MTAVHGQSMRVVFAFKINASRDAARLRNYWRPKLAQSATGAFWCIVRRNVHAQALHVHRGRKIGHTICAPIQKAALIAARSRRLSRCSSGTHAVVIYLIVTRF